MPALEEEGSMGSNLHPSIMQNGGAGSRSELPEKLVEVIEDARVRGVQRLQHA